MKHEQPSGTFLPYLEEEQETRSETVYVPARLLMATLQTPSFSSEWGIDTPEVLELRCQAVLPAYRRAMFVGISNFFQPVKGKLYFKTDN